MTGRRALAGITFAAVTSLAAGAATAQVPYQIGDDRGNVTVDMGVLEGLGPLPTVPEMLRPGTPVGELGYDPRVGTLAAVQSSRGSAPGYPARRAGAPTLGIDNAPAPDWLRRPDAPRYAPLPETLSAPAPQRAVPRGSAPTLTPPAATAPAATSRAAAPTLRQPEPKPAASAAASSPPPPRAEPQPTEPRPAAAKPSAPSVPPPPKPAATASAAPPPPPPVPAAKAPELPKAPPPPALPTATAPAPDKPTPSAPAKETQVAAATTGPATSSPAPSPSSQSVAGDVVRVPFDPNQSALPSAAAAGLDAVVARLRKDSSLRVQLMAYADGDEDNANKARRLSLSRALAVRAYLIDKQIQSTRMDVRALGNRTNDSPKDRVDVVLVSR